MPIPETPAGLAELAATLLATDQHAASFGYHTEADDGTYMDVSEAHDEPDTWYWEHRDVDGDLVNSKVTLTDLRQIHHRLTMILIVATHRSQQP